ncbi:Helix-turn-helix domain-containing protein [Saccharopolyspora flava]|uniref:Helix-turn-helix domain-containing protein n=1 Tax=Saccharopolyspora flava TaxID=95161 RepID=A0A1I6QIR3_9PSEU|nr:Helix-turn-helix domain-containing protein [Saccharopolyspora flava]
MAAQAGVSVNYYERLERGRAPRPSPQVLAALGRALRLTDAEHEHLARLAGQIPPSTRAPVPDDARRLLDGLGAIPAYLVDERQDIVAWNRAATALLTDFAQLPAEDRNALKLPSVLGTLCTAAPGSEGEFLKHTAAQLRTASARYPTDRGLGELINDLAARSPEFAAAWRAHDVRPRLALRKRLHHPELGRLDLDLRTLQLPSSSHQLAMYTAEPGSPAARAFTHLL